MNFIRKNSVILFLSLLAFPIGISSGIQSEGDLPLRFKTWLEEEVSYIITPLEKEVFLQLQSDRERELFIEAFWKQRDPTSGTPENEFKDEHYRRINYANYNFGRSAPLPGWKTDRGRIYIILGEPRGIDRYTGETQIFNTEVWFYQGLTHLGLPTGFNLVFFQKDGVGEYCLYSPSADGPQALLTSYFGDQADYVQAYQTLKKVNPQLANVSLSLIPGESTLYGRPSLASDMMISSIYSVPQKELKDKYAEKFLAYKDIVEVEYSTNYIDNDSSIKILQNPPGIYFVHYVVEIMRFSLQQYQDKYSTHLKVNGNVTDSEGKTIYQYEGAISVELNEDQLKSITYKPFAIYDMFPLTAGSYKFSVIIKNEVSKEFTTVEKDIIIPEENSPLGMSSLVLGYKMTQASPEGQNLKPFKLGSFQFLHQPKNIFLQKDTLFLAFQITGLSSDLRQKGQLRYEFFKDDEPFLNFTQNISQLEGGVNFKQEFALQEFSPGYYRLRVGLWDGDQEILSEEENFGISSVPEFPRPWIHTKTLPPPDNPVYSLLLAKQLLSKGEANEAQPKLEEAFQKKPDSLDFALPLGQVYFIQKKYSKVKQVLTAFSDVPEVPYQLYLILGKSHQALGEFDQAIALYDKALSRYGINANLLNSIGECYYSLGLWEEALAAWEKSLEINGDQPDVEEKVKTLKKKTPNQRPVW
ncbi:MAG: GWxTD domain-containing protein [Candidatus Aminicenantes bacterium]|jgi:GWxTD domain-containing protein